MSIPTPGRRRALTLMATLPWPVVLFQFLFILPGYDKLFRQFGLKIDDLTGLVLNLSRWLKANTGLAFGITLGLMFMAVGIVHAVQSTDLPRTRRAAILTFVFGVPCLIFFVAWLTVANTDRILVDGLKK
jgi:type II secretory pathway component PulF